MRRSPALALPAVVALLLGGCAADPDPDSADGIPASWLQSTADGWPDSDAFGGDLPVLDSSTCVLGDVLPEILGEQPDSSDSGWGSYGDDPEARDAYRYVCDFSAEGRYAGSIQLIQAPDDATAQETVDTFTSQADTSEQDNTVSTVSAGQLDVHVLTRWYPTNPQGEYQAMYLDEDANALVILEVNSLDEEDFDAYSDDAAAKDLLFALAAGS